MDSIIEGFSKAFFLILHFDPELLGIIFLSLEVSGTALILATIFGLPLGALTGLKKFPGRGFMLSILNTFMGLPPVVVGLFLYLLLSRRGPIGFMSLLYTPSAMIIAQLILAFPIVAALSHSAIVKIEPLIKQASLTLGATPFQVTTIVMKEARYGIMAGYTRVMTTTIALETDKGNFELALALGIILLTISFIIKMLLYLIQRKGN